MRGMAVDLLKESSIRGNTTLRPQLQTRVCAESAGLLRMLYMIWARIDWDLVLVAPAKSRITNSLTLMARLDLVIFKQNKKLTLI